MQKTPSKTVVTTLLVIIGVIILIIAFEGGEAVGYHKALFSYKWSENYEKNFAGPAKPFRGAHPDDFLNSNGASGIVLTYHGDILIIKDNNNTEETITTASSTVIRKLNDTVGTSTVKIGDHVVVLGVPGASGNIEAKFIRILNTQ